MVENLFKLGCLMFICFIAFAYLIVSLEQKAVTTRKQMPTYVVTPEAPAVVEQKKACGCCTERIARFREKLQQARERKKVKQQVANAETS